MILASELPPAWTKLRPHPIQSQMWRSRQKYVTVAAGRGSGKTELALRKGVLFSRIKNAKGFYGGPTVQQAKRVAWDRTIALFPPSWIESINHSNLIITTIFGSEFHIVGMDKPHRIEGNQWHWCILDESADLKPGTFKRSVFPALTHYGLWCWRIGVPKRTGIGVREYKQAYDDSAKKGAAFTWPSSTILSPEIIEEAKETLDPKTYQEQFEATWETAAGGIYSSFDQIHNVDDRIEYDPNQEIIVGSDFNVNPMSWTLAQNRTIDGVKRLEVFDELFIRDTTTAATMAELLKRYPEHNAGWCFYGDAAGKNRSTNATRSDYQIIKDYEGFGRKSIKYPKKNPRRRDRFAATNGMLCNANGKRRLFIHPRCINLIEDLMSRSYKEGTMEPDDSGDQGHLCDALDYIIYAKYPIGWENLVGQVPKAGRTR